MKISVSGYILTIKREKKKILLGAGKLRKFHRKICEKRHGVWLEIVLFDIFFIRDLKVLC